jgi:alcohol dehydrogenase
VGAIATVNASEVSSVVEAIQELSCGGVHLSLDALGHRETLYHSISGLRKRGRHVQVGILPPEQTDAPVPIGKIMSYELELYGSHGMQAWRYPEMLAMIEADKLQPEKLIHSTVSLAEAADLLPRLNQLEGAGMRVITSPLPSSAPLQSGARRD